MLCFSGSSWDDQGSPLPLHMGVLPTWAQAVRWEARSLVSLFIAPQFRRAGQASKIKKKDEAA